MKKIIFSTALLVFALSACKNSTNEAGEKEENQSDTLALNSETESPELYYFGDSINAEGALDVSSLLAMMEGKDSLNLKLSGVVNSSCQRKGCWMKMDMGDGQELRVRFKDYGFFVPTNLDGEEAIVEGSAYIDTLDVDYLRHLAEDAGKSEEEIAQITEPEISVNFTAIGVIIKS